METHRTRLGHSVPSSPSTTSSDRSNLFASPMRCIAVSCSSSRAISVYERRGSLRHSDSSSADSSAGSLRIRISRSAFNSCLGIGG